MRIKGGKDMRNLTKRLAALILGLVMVLGIATPVTAAQGQEVISSITIEVPHIHGLTVTMTDVYNAYLSRYWHNGQPMSYMFFLREGGTISFNRPFQLADEEWTAHSFGAGQIVSIAEFGGLFYHRQDGDYYYFASFSAMSANTTMDSDFMAMLLDHGEIFFDLSEEGFHPLIGLAVTTAAPNLSTASTWAHDGINQAFELGLIPQSLQNNYTNNITRAEFATLAVALYESQRGTITGRITFTDTNDINVQKAVYIGVVTGVGDNKFNPNGQLTREQAAVMLARLANAIGQPLSQSASTFADNNQISDWAIQAVGQIQTSGIMGGVGDNRFAPQGDYTREQSIITIMRLLETMN